MKGISTGIEDFKELLDKKYYYVDKSNLINDVLDEKVVLYTRPRRFGKTLNMSMLYYFFSIKQSDNAYLFDGLEINKNSEAMEHQNKYPVIFLTLKDMKRNRYSDQVAKYAALIGNIVTSNSELENSQYLNQEEKELLAQYRGKSSSLSDLQDALFNISVYLEKHYHQKVIIMIDEYDVPLQSAYINDYYDEMSNFIGNVFSAALKTNDSLEKGIMTGCLRIAKESIFTGLNNFNVYSIMDEYSSNYFGFNKKEIDQLLDYYDLIKYSDKLKQWYDGYLFGQQEIYNPWSTLKYINKLLRSNDDESESFWANTSSNSIIYDYINQSNQNLRDEFDRLVNGDGLIKEIKPELTYREMDNIDNIYSFLLFTGYLKTVNRIALNTYELMIPNYEIKLIYTSIFKDWLKEKVNEVNTPFMKALLDGDELHSRKLLNEALSYTISYFDYQESFYHGFLAGMLQEAKSNREAGNGRYDLAYLPNDFDDPGFVIECKIAKSIKELKSKSEEACKQIKESGYIKGINEDGYTNIHGYGIAFYKKKCFITKIE